MIGAILLNRKILDLGGLPEFTYTGDFVSVDDGSESGFWKLAFTSSGLLTLTKKIKLATIQAQAAGGGGGAANEFYDGTDGKDGTIESLVDVELVVGQYQITLGEAGARGYNSAGYKGGDTSFGDVLIVAGGAGGSRAGGSRNQTHTSIYEDYGKGGLGGTPSQYTGSASYKWVFTASGICYMYNQPSSINGQNMGSLSSGQTVYLASSTVYSATDGSSDKFYKTESGYYVATTRGSIKNTLISDTRKWYGVAGNSGVVLLSGKA